MFCFQNIQRSTKHVVEACNETPSWDNVEEREGARLHSRSSKMRPCVLQNSISRFDHPVLKWNARVLRTGSGQNGPAHGSPAPGDLFLRPLQDGGRLLELRRCSNWDSYLEKFQEKKIAEERWAWPVSNVGPHTRESQFTTTTLTYHFAANTTFYCTLYVYPKFLQKYPSPNPSLSNHR